jgi:hypothetical protein
VPNDAMVIGIGLAVRPEARGQRPELAQLLWLSALA